MKHNGSKSRKGQPTKWGKVRPAILKRRADGFTVASRKKHTQPLKSTPANILRVMARGFSRVTHLFTRLLTKPLGNILISLVQADNGESECPAVPCCALLCPAVPCCALLCPAVPCCALLCPAVPCCGVALLAALPCVDDLC
jgi:hypothetical protein